jgi:hypothetical protein
LESEGRVVEAASERLVNDAKSEVAACGIAVRVALRRVTTGSGTDRGLAPARGDGHGRTSPATRATRRIIEFIDPPCAGRTSEQRSVKPYCAIAAILSRNRGGLAPMSHDSAEVNQLLSRRWTVRC